MVQLAASVEPSTRSAMHRGVPPEAKLTEPVGVPAPGACAATVAVRVTLCPATGVEGPDVTVVAVEAGTTATVVVPERTRSSVSAA